MSPRNTIALAALLTACEASSPPRDAAPDVTDATTDLAPDVTLPDLTATVRFPLVQERVFLPTSCDVIEGCTVPGRRRLLRFDLTTPNQGPGDLVLGPPVINGRAQPGFEWGDCHGHFHFSGYADYRLVSLDGAEVLRRREAFKISGLRRSFKVIELIMASDCLKDFSTKVGSMPRAACPI